MKDRKIRQNLAAFCVLISVIYVTGQFAMIAGKLLNIWQLTWVQTFIPTYIVLLPLVYVLLIIAVTIVLYWLIDEVTR